MQIYELIWPEDRVDHIAQHGVLPEEVEQICFSQPLIQQAKSKGQNPVYYVLGQTESGQHLFSLIIQLPDGKGYRLQPAQ